MEKDPFPPLDQKLPWERSQAEFITHVLCHTAMSIIYDIAGYLTPDAMGELFLKVYDVDISPYPDFETMRIAHGPTEDPALVFARFDNEAKKIEDIYDLIDGTGVRPSEETEKKMFAGLAILLDLRERLKRHVVRSPDFERLHRLLKENGFI